MMAPPPRWVSIATVIFAGSVHAVSDREVYRGLAAGNPDLSTDLDSVVVQSELVPGLYDAFVYNGFEQGNTERSSGVKGLLAPSAWQCNGSRRYPPE